MIGSEVEAEQQDDGRWNLVCETKFQSEDVSVVFVLVSVAYQSILLWKSRWVWQEIKRRDPGSPLTLSLTLILTLAG